MGRVRLKGNIFLDENIFWIFWLFRDQQNMSMFSSQTEFWGNSLNLNPKSHTNWKNYILTILRKCY